MSVFLALSFSGCGLIPHNPKVTVNMYADTKLDQTGDNFNDTILNIYPNQKDIYFLLLVDAAIRKQVFHQEDSPDSEAVFSFRLARDGSISKLKLVSSNTDDESFIESRKNCINDAAPFYAAPEGEGSQKLPNYTILYHF